MDARASSTSTGPASAVRAYAARCRAALPEGFQVRSYAGLWLLLATLAPVTTGAGREELERVLGVPVEEAAAIAAQLLADRRDDLGAAVAGWLRAGMTLTGAAPVRLDPLPDQAGLDAWAEASTRGRITAFPLSPTPETVLVLASALVAETRWQQPLEVDGNRLLVDERGLVAVVDTLAAGLVAVAVPAGRGNLDVVSVIADPELPTEWVWAAVDEVTGWVADATLLERRVPAVDLTSGHAWEVRRTRMVVPPSSASREVWDAAVPAWTRETSTDLTDAPGVGPVASAVLGLIGVSSRWAACVQGATATCTSYGFDAAAITALDFMGGGAEEPPQPRKVHHVSLRFDRPHAVVAVARGGAWDGVPLVHAWIDGETNPGLANPEPTSA